MSVAAAKRIVEMTIGAEGSLGVIPVPFDPVAVFGKVRAPVKVTVNGHAFRSTIARMHGSTFIPFRRSHQEAAGVARGDRVKVRIEADTEARVVRAPADLARALKAKPGLWAQWGRLSYTHQRECVESVLGARKPETRERRIARSIELVNGALAKANRSARR
jgi:hypothetical protein